MWSGVQFSLSTHDRLRDRDPDPRVSIISVRTLQPRGADWSCKMVSLSPRSVSNAPILVASVFIWKRSTISIQRTSQGSPRSANEMLLFSVRNSVGRSIDAASSLSGAAPFDGKRTGWCLIGFPGSRSIRSVLSESRGGSTCAIPPGFVTHCWRKWPVYETVCALMRRWEEALLGSTLRRVRPS